MKFQFNQELKFKNIYFFSSILTKQTRRLFYSLIFLFRAFAVLLGLPIYPFQRPPSSERQKNCKIPLYLGRKNGYSNASLRVGTFGDAVSQRVERPRSDVCLNFPRQTARLGVCRLATFLKLNALRASSRKSASR